MVCLEKRRREGKLKKEKERKKERKKESGKKKKERKRERRKDPIYFVRTEKEKSQLLVRI